MINAYSFTRMIELLMQGEVTKTEIIEQTGLHHATVGAYVRHMHKRRLLRIAEWRRDKRGRTWVPYFTLNPDGLRDDARPARSSSAERSATHRAKRRAIKMNHILVGRLA